MTYFELFEGQKVKFWPIDEKVPDSKVSVISMPVGAALVAARPFEPGGVRGYPDCGRG